MTPPRNPRQATAFIVDDELLQRLTELEQLQKLTLPASEYSADGLRSLAKLPKLRELHLNMDVATLPIIETLKQLPHLEYLALTVNQLGKPEAKALAQMGALRELSTGAGTKGFVISEICRSQSLQKLRMPRLKQLNFASRNIGHEPQRLRDIAAYKTVPRLVLSRSLIDEQAARILASMDNLKTTLSELQLHATDLSQIGDILLGAFTNLRKLDLRSAVFGRSSLAPLGELQQLENLSLYSTDVTDEQLKALRGLESIRELNLGKCSQITNASLGTLLSLRGLRLLDVQETAITRDAVDDLRAAMPALRIRGGGAKRWEWQYEGSKSETENSVAVDTWRPDRPNYECT